MNSISANMAGAGLPASIQSQLAAGQFSSLQKSSAGIQSSGASSSTGAAIPTGNSSSPGANVGEDFESVFVSMMLKQMRGSMTEEGLFAGDSSDTWGGIFDMYMSKHLAGSNPLGIGDMVNSYVESESKS